MTKGTTFDEAMRAMRSRRVRWPITRAMAIREHGVPKDVLEEMERRGLVRVGKVPVQHLPPPTNDARLDPLIRDLTELGVRWPAWREEVRGHYGVTAKTVRALCRHGLIRGRELDEGSLTPTLVDLLETLGIESRAEFRARWASGELDAPGLRKMRHVGLKALEMLMEWAYGSEAPPCKVGLNLRVPQETKDGLESLRELHGLATSDAMVEKLVEDALGTASPRFRIGR